VPQINSFVTTLPTVNDGAPLPHHRALRIRPGHAGNLALREGGHQGQGD